MSVIQKEYPDIWEDDFDDENAEWYIGQSAEDDEDDGTEWLNYEDAVEFCGFCEGAVENAYAQIDGNGPWAQGMIRCRDFSGYAFREEDKRRRKATSDRYWEAHKRGASLSSNVKVES